MFEFDPRKKEILSNTANQAENVFHSSELLVETLMRVMHALLCKHSSDDNIDESADSHFRVNLNSDPENLEVDTITFTGSHVSFFDFIRLF